MKKFFIKRIKGFTPLVLSYLKVNFLYLELGTERHEPDLNSWYNISNSTCWIVDRIHTSNRAKIPYYSTFYGCLLIDNKIKLILGYDTNNNLILLASSNFVEKYPRQYEQIVRQVVKSIGFNKNNCVIVNEDEINTLLRTTYETKLEDYDEDRISAIANEVLQKEKLILSEEIVES